MGLFIIFGNIWVILERSGVYLELSFYEGRVYFELELLKGFLLEKSNRVEGLFNK